MCIGFCFPFNLKFQEWINVILLVFFVFLIFIAVWKDAEQGKIKKYKKELARRKPETNKQLYNTQKRLEYFGNLIVRQILDPYIIFPLFVLLAILFVNNNWEFGQTTVLTITFIAILWYSRETLVLRQKQQELNRISKKANEIAMGRPLIFIIKEDDGNYISVKNFGNNTAKNVIIKFIMDGKVDKKIEFPVVVAGGKEIPYPIEEKFTSLIDACDPKFQVKIEYNDLFEKNLYRTEFFLNKDVLVVRGKGRFKISSDEKVKPREE